MRAIGVLVVGVLAIATLGRLAVAVATRPRNAVGEVPQAGEDRELSDRRGVGEPLQSERIFRAAPPRRRGAARRRPAGSRRSSNSRLSPCCL
jgi:hypothetical protein